MEAFHHQNLSTGARKASPYIKDDFDKRLKFFLDNYCVILVIEEDY